MPTRRGPKATVFVDVLLRNDGQAAFIDGPPTEADNGSFEFRAPPTHDKYKAIAYYAITGPYVPHFPHNLPGEPGVNDWLDSLRKDGFEVKKVD